MISHIGSECPEPGPYKWCWLLTCCTRFGASGSEVGSRHQEQNREGGKAQSGQYMASWAGPLQLVSERGCDSVDFVSMKSTLNHVY